MRGLDFVFVYIDDLLVASRSEDEHKIHPDLIFQRLQEYGLANFAYARCRFRATNSCRMDFD